MMINNSKVSEWEEDGYKIVRSVARSGPGCHEGCGVLLFVKDGKLIKVEGDPENPFNQGRLCPRCLALPQVVYHPDRLKYPMKRKGKRGEGKWEKITWDEAYESIANRLEEIRETWGPESVIFCQGTGRDIPPYLAKLAYSFGSPNRVVFGPLNGHACFAPRAVSLALNMGEQVVADCSQFLPERYENSEWRNPECIVMWGNNPTFSNPDGFLGPWIVECMKRGSQIIVIDPRRTWFATKAKVWLQIRPGTDAALALGMLNVIINEDLIDKDFVQKWTHGFDELRSRVQDFPPEKVSQITWIPTQKIIEAARSYARAKPSAIQWGVAVDQSKECLATIQGIMALWTITGNVDIPGGNIFKNNNFGVEMHIAKMCSTLSDEMKERKIGWGMYPLLDLVYPMAVGSALYDHMEKGEPYPIKAAWIQTTNTFACGGADARRIYALFKKLDFVTVVDLFMTPTAMAFADIVLPAATYAERDGISLLGGNSTYLGAINKAIEPVGDCKSDMEIILALGKRLNSDSWPWENIHDMFNDMIEPMGITFKEFQEMGLAYDKFEYHKHEKGLLRPDNKPGFKTKTGKIELYSTVFKECGLDPLPYFEEPPESPVSLSKEDVKKYPLVLTTGAKVPGFFHSEHRQIPFLRQLNPDPITEIHPETAEKSGIRDGDWIYIENRYGRCRQRAKLTYDIHPKVVSAQHGWWFPEQDGSEPNLFGVWVSNINLLLPSDWTGKSGFGYPFKSQMCRVYKENGVLNA